MRVLLSDYSDELLRQATVTLETGTADTGYGVERLYDDNPAHVFRSPDDQVAIQIDCGAATEIAALALIHTTLEDDDDVRIQGNTSASWASPAFDLAFPIAGWTGAGSSRWPLNSFLNLLLQAGYASGGYRYYRLAFGLTTPLAQALQIGQIRLHSSMREFYIDRSAQPAPQKPDVVNTTSAGVDHIVSRGTTRWGMKFSLGGFEDAERASFDAHWHDVNGREHPFLFVTDEETRLVRWDSDLYQLTRATSKQATMAGSVREVSRGLRPGV